MPVVSDETETVLNDEVLGRGTALSRRAAHQFAELPMAQAALKFASARHANQCREIDHASAPEDTSVVNVSLGAWTPSPPSRWGRRACVRGSPGS